MLKNKHSQKITTVEVAKKARVSLETVSRVLNNDIRVALEKCERVYAAIQNLGYVANRQAKSLKGWKTNVIGVLVLTWRPVTLARFYMATYEYADRYPVPSKLSNDINLFTIFPDSVVTDIKYILQDVKDLHDKDLRDGLCWVLNSSVHFLGFSLFIDYARASLIRTIDNKKLVIDTCLHR